MAWLGRFGDFEQFDEYLNEKTTFKQNQSFRSRGGSNEHQQTHQNPAEVKKLCDITSQTTYAVR